MSDLFFYGTLCHKPLLEIVLGRTAGCIDARPGRLPDHAVFWARDEVFPLIAPAPGQNTPGLLVRGLDAEDLARLNFYEGGFGYGRETVQLTLENGEFAAAEVFFPEPGLWTPGDPWSLTDWAARWGALSCRAATEAMGYFGRIGPAELALRFPAIRRRAASWLAAQASPADPAHDAVHDVRLIDHRFAHLNFHGIEEARIQFRRHDGAMSPELDRSALMTGAAAVVLPYDPVRDTVLLIEQFRAPLYLAGDPAPWLWEPVAGLIDPGETPEQTAHREAMEEAGLVLRNLEKVGEAYSSSGSSGEFVHLYVGIADLTGAEGIGGLASEGEDIRSAAVRFDALIAAIDAHRHRDMPLLVTALWLARHRERLRTGAGVSSFGQ
ncbi:NUDIX domain-containing protein [Antarcticimicrobium luteum]|uniref:ADP-ribose pyrophosphatase n=1 Tax=Antarcticimicrobium luteum TaxID=2547397 RepID=A0A4R5VDD8_9RHOB|nr:NUDIX domain-containing protein [Antarcticimicrobium luteum]TDK50293.1 NUDIX domain-containing protein [Antarcticimicrobium luteum]